MKLPEALYQPSAKDVGSFIGELVALPSRATGAVFTLSLTAFTVPLDRLFLLFAANAQGVPGSGLDPQVQSIGIAVTTPLDTSSTATIASEFGEQFPTLAGGRLRVNFSGEAWVRPGGEVRVVATFGGNGAANVLSAGVVGMMIPKGQIR